MNNKNYLILLIILLSSFHQQKDTFFVSEFTYKKSKVTLELLNSSSDTIIIPNLFLRMKGKGKNKVELRQEFYKVSHDTLYLIISEKPTLSSVSMTHKFEGVYIEGVYNDYRVAPKEHKRFIFYIDSKYKHTPISNIKIQYDDLVVLSPLKQ